MAGALGHFTVVCDAIGDRGVSRALIDAVTGRSWVLRELGRTAEAAEVARNALTLAREAGYPRGEALSLTSLSRAALAADDLGSAVRLARQARQITAGIPGWVARLCSFSLTDVLLAAGDTGAAEAMCAAGLAASRDTGSQENLPALLNMMAALDLRAGRTGDAAAHLREALQVELRTGDWTELLNSLDSCGLLCAATGRCTEAVTLWAAHAALFRHGGLSEWPADTRLREQPLNEARRALGPALTRTAEDRGLRP